MQSAKYLLTTICTTKNISFRIKIIRIIEKGIPDSTELLLRTKLLFLGDSSVEEKKKNKINQKQFCSLVMQ